MNAPARPESCLQCGSTKLAPAERLPASCWRCLDCRAVFQLRSRAEVDAEIAKLTLTMTDQPSKERIAAALALAEAVDAAARACDAPEGTPPDLFQRTWLARCEALTAYRATLRGSGTDPTGYAATLTSHSWGTQ